MFSMSYVFISRLLELQPSLLFMVSSALLIPSPLHICNWGCVTSSPSLILGSVAKTKGAQSFQEGPNRISFVYLLWLGSWREIVIAALIWELSMTWHWGLLASNCLGLLSSLCKRETAITGQCHPRTFLIIVSMKSFGLHGKPTVWEEMVYSFWKSLVLLPFRRQVIFHVLQDLAQCCTEE